MVGPNCRKSNWESEPGAAEAQRRRRKRPAETGEVTVQPGKHAMERRARATIAGFDTSVAKVQSALNDFDRRIAGEPANPQIQAIRRELRSSLRTCLRQRARAIRAAKALGVTPLWLVQASGQNSDDQQQTTSDEPATRRQP